MYYEEKNASQTGNFLWVLILAQLILQSNNKRKLKKIFSFSFKNGAVLLIDHHVRELAQPLYCYHKRLRLTLMVDNQHIWKNTRCIVCSLALKLKYSTEITKIYLSREIILEFKIKTNQSRCEYFIQNL